MKTVTRVGVIGLGFMGSRWTRAFAENADARLDVVSDVQDDLGRETAARWGARHVGHAMDVVADPRLDGVAICTPEHLHVDLAMAAIDAGKSVVVEKPLAHTVEAAERIRDRAAEKGVPVLVGHILRFDPRYAAIRRAVETGDVGEVQAVRSERVGLVSDQDILHGRTSIPLYYGVHEFDLARWFAGPVDRIWAARSSGVLRAHGHDVHDLYSVGLTFASGAHGTALLGWSLPRGLPGFGIAGFTVIGQRGVASVRQGESGFLKAGADGQVAEDFTYAPELHGRLGGAIAAQADHFVRCARGVDDPLCDAAEATEAVRISLAMQEAAETGEVVRVE